MKHMRDLKGGDTMARAKNGSKKRPEQPLQPYYSPEDAENLAISLAYDLVLERLRDGTATSQETVHFLKLGSSRNQAEMEKLREENTLLKAKTNAIKSAGNLEKLYANVISAIKKYNGISEEEEEIDEDYD